MSNKNVCFHWSRTCKYNLVLILETRSHHFDVPSSLSETWLSPGGHWHYLERHQHCQHIASGQSCIEFKKFTRSSNELTFNSSSKFPSLSMNERKERNFELELKVSSIQLLLNFIQLCLWDYRKTRTLSSVSMFQEQLTQTLIVYLLHKNSCFHWSKTCKITYFWCRGRQPSFRYSLQPEWVSPVARRSPQTRWFHPDRHQHCQPCAITLLNQVFPHFWARKKREM